MDTSAIDLPALTLAAIIALAITLLLWAAQRGDNSRRGWLVAAVITAVLLATGLIDLLRAKPRETHVAAVLLGASLPVLGSAGLVRGTRRVRPLVRWPLVFLTAVVLLLAGVLLGAALVPKLLGS